MTVIGITTFMIGSILQMMNMNAETETVVSGLNELTYFGAIILGLSIFIWLIILNYSVFTDWNWLKTKTKADDISALIMFIVCVPILLSLIIFILYDLIGWYDWYINLNSFKPLFSLVWSSLRSLEGNMVFWFIFILSISFHSALAIFLYKAKTKKMEIENQSS